MIKAKFIGDSSCGFTHGHTYTIYTKIRKLNQFSTKQYIWAYTETHSAECPYESVEAFLRNWEVLKVT